MPAPAVVQACGASGNSGASLPLTAAFPSNVTPGNLIVVYFGGAANRTFTISDGTNNYEQDIYQGPREAIGIAACPFIFLGQGGSQAVTMSITQSGANTAAAFIAEEWTGLGYAAQVPPGTATAAATNSGASSVTTGTGGTTTTIPFAGMLALSCLATAGDPGTTTTLSVASPFTASTSSPQRNATIGIAAGWWITTSNAAVTATFNWTNALQYGGATAIYFPTWSAGVGWTT